MKERLQGPAGPGIRVGVKFLLHQSSHDSSREVVLIGKSGEGEAMPLCAQGDARPIDVRRNIDNADAGKR